MLPGRPDGRLLVGGVLQFDHGKRQAVDEQHHVGSAMMVVLDDGELVYGQPVVVVWRVEVEHPRLRAGDRAVLAAVFHRDAVHQQAMDRPVA